VLQIAAILPGQSPPERFAIPSRKSSLAEQPQPKEPTTAATDQDNASQPAPQAPPPKAHPPLQAQQAQSAQQVQQAQQTQQTPAPAVSSRDIKHDSGTEAVTSGLKNVDINSSRRLEPEHNPVRRMDSQTSEVDEFHDAEQ
jgi:hypothetical protein